MENEVAKCVINISDIANIVMAIASVVNLIIVIWIFKKERKEAKSKITYDKKDNWYSSLGLKDITISFSNKVNDLKNDSLKFFNNKIKQDEYIKIYKKVDDEFLQYKNEYLTIVDCVDNSLTNKLTEEFQQIQDELYKLVSIMLGDKSLKTNSNPQDIIIKFDDIRKKIIKMSININK